MSQSGYPPNWVVLRAKCHVDLIFMALRDVVKRDVDEVNKLDPSQRYGWTFEFQNGASGTIGRFSVVRRHPNYQGTTHAVFFEQHSNKVTITLPNKDEIAVIPEWEESTATCHLTLDDVRLEPWQVSQKALAHFFFDG